MSALYVVAGALLGAGLGIQAFLSFLVAPASFRILDRPQAVRLMEGVFPGYYASGLVLVAGALVAVLLLILREHGSRPLRWVTLVLLVVTLGGTAYAGQVLLPEAHAARLRAENAPAGDLSPLRFSRLHRQAVAVNIALFMTSVLALALHAAGPPRGVGGRDTP